jgi:glycosyltransferase involved in cell wall biosynthesis
MNILIDGQTLHTPEINRGIGTYFKEMVEAILAQDFVNAFYITIDSQERLSVLTPFAQNKLIPLISQECNPAFFLEDRSTASKKYTSLMKSYCENESIDYYWNPNPQMFNTILPSTIDGVFSFATIYDLIPYVMKKEYFSKWSKELQGDYQERLERLKAYDHLFPISESTQSDIEKIMGVSKSNQTVAFCGVSDKFKPYPFPTIAVDQRYILYIGGFDPRKNMFKAIDAFSLFTQEYDDNQVAYMLYIVCHLSSEARDELLNYIRKKGIEDRVVLTGFLDEQDLLRVYQKASCFFFPSLYEGFGLPILEALASGISVASANNSSLPEVAKEYAHYFDASDIDQMAKALRDALKESQKQKDRFKRYDYASQYRWDKPAKLILSYISSRSLKSVVQSVKRSLAWVSPLPPQKSGISIYSKVLLFSMRDDADIDIYYDGVEPDQLIQKSFSCLPLKKLSQHFQKYDEVIYHIGNNTAFHKNIYKYAWNYPSTLLVHDWNIQHFMKEAFDNKRDREYYKEAESIFNRVDIDETSKRLPSMVDAIVAKSKRVIVHHQWVKKQLHRRDHVEVIPLFSFIEEAYTHDDIASLRGKFNVSDKIFLITVFGDVNHNKLPSVVIEAIKLLIDEGYPIELLFVGKIQNETRDLFTTLTFPYNKKIRVTDYVESLEYYSYLYASDLIINLRNPSMGEASFTLAEALYAKKPIIIGDLNQYKEFPDHVIAGKIPYDGNEIDSLSQLIKKILNKPLLRKKIALNAKEYSKSILGLDRVKKSFLRDVR